MVRYKYAPFQMAMDIWIFISIGSLTAVILPYHVSLLLGIGGFLVLNGIKNRLKLSTTTDRLIKSNFIVSI